MTETQAGGRRLINATAVMASGTMVSRVLGLVRAMLIAFVLGNGTRQVEAFNYANTVPTTLYLLLAGGTLNNVLVPQIVRAVTHDEDGGRAFVDRIITAFVMALGALTVVVTVTTPLVMSMFARAWTAPDMADHWASLLLMSYICMPQLFFYGVFFLIGQVLNARDKFGPMMWAPIANNVVSIAVFALYLAIWGNQTALTGEPFTVPQAWLLAGGSTLGIIVQTLVLLPFLKRAGFSYRPRFDLKGTGLGRTFHVAKWMVGYVALTTLVQMLVANLASQATSATDQGAGWTVYQNAYLIWILPHSLLTVSLATAMLPSASRYAVAGDRSGVAAETTRALRLATTFLLPASVGLLVLADPVTRLAFGNGTGASDYIYIAWALMAFAIGLVPFTIQYLYLRAFFAMDNTRTPFLLQIWISGANAVAALALALPWNNPTTVAARLALAYSLSYFVGVFLTHVVLRRRVPELPGVETLTHLARLLVATVPAAALAWGITWWTERYPSLLIRTAGLAVAGILAVLVFFFTAKRLRIPETTALLEQLRRPKGDEGQTDAAEAIADAEAGAPEDRLVASAPEPVPDANGVGVFVPVAPPAPVASALLSLPAPPIAGTPEAEASAGGRVLGERYRLADQLAVHNRAQTWRADDLVLGRAVLVHLLDADAPATATVLDASREAALATDSRFLRVLDVVESEPGVGPYLVYEYAPGQTLEKVLRDGPLTGVEAAWIVREVADGLIGLHAQEHYHRHLSPATLLITSTGNVKVLGSALTDAEEAPSHLSGEAADVRALGQLLYACLVAHWPGGERYGMPAAPIVEGHWVLPSQVHGGVAPAVDRVVDRLLSPVPRGHASRLTTAQDVTTQLSLVLGPMGAAHDLQARLHPDVDPDTEDAPPAPVSQVAPPIPTPASASRFSVHDVIEDESPHTPAAESATSPGPGPQAQAASPVGADLPVWAAPAVEASPPVEVAPPVEASPEEDPYPGEFHYTNAELYGEDDPRDETQPFVDEALRRSESFTPVPPPAGVRPSSGPEQPARRGRLMPLLFGVLALVVVVGIVAVVAMNVREPAGPTTPAAGAVQIEAATAFDPKTDGGDASENSKRTQRAIDGDASTVWRTEKYGSAQFNGRKPGVGLVLDLGVTRTVSSVQITMEDAGATVELRVPAKPAKTAPMKSVEQWESMATAKDAPKTFTLTPVQPVETRFLLVYLSELPSVAKGVYRGGVAEVVVNAR